MQPPGRISLFFVVAGSSPAGLFSVSRSALLPAGLPFLQRPAFSVGWPAFVDRPVLLPAATISAAGLYSFSAGSLPSAALLCCRGVCFGAGFAGPVFDPFLSRRAFAFGCSALLPGHLLCAGPAGPVFGPFRFPPGPYFVGPSVCRWQRSSCRFSSRGVTGLVIRASHPASSARRRSVSKA
mgnify:CR=1 FL=1